MAADGRDWRTEIATLNELLASYRAELERRPGPEEYGLSLHVEQEKTQLLMRAVVEAARLFVDDLERQGCAVDPKVTAWLTSPIVIAALNEAKG